MKARQKRKLKKRFEDMTKEKFSKILEEGKKRGEKWLEKNRDIYEAWMKEMDEEFNFDLERMKKAISGPSLTIPHNLTREQMRWYICNASIGEREGLFAPPQNVTMEELTQFALEMWEKYND